MANLTAVLRKTIDGLPNATPQLRAKVYEKARAAITRQIQAADPPLAENVVEQRYRVLEDAIAETEAHYGAIEGGAERGSAGAPVTPPSEPLARPVAPAAPSTQVAERPVEPIAPPPPPPVEERPAPPPFPRATPTVRSPSPAPASFGAPARPSESSPIRTSDLGADTKARVVAPVRPAVDEPAAEPKVGEIGPAEPAMLAPPSRPADRPLGAGLRPAASLPSGDEPNRRPSPGALLSGIPEADMAAPRYPARRAARRGRGPLLAGVAAVALIALGTAGWIYQDDIRETLTGSTQVASVPSTMPAATTDSGETAVPPAGETPATPVPPSGTPSEGVAPAPSGGVQPRQFTQRLLPDGSEVDEGPSPNAANAFEEGTDVAAASVTPPTDTPATPADTAATPVAPTAPAAASTTADASATVPVGQRAVFYEERSADREGSQQSGNVVWSVVNEPPADGQPPEPAIRAVAEMPNDQLKMTLTIRRNADTTLPASHVIEIMFDTPPDFPGGQIENVQRLALKPTEQARGEPLIGVAGKISDGFFIIALNDLKQAVDSNLGLLGREEWIDIPLAYSTGQRALMSIEKGIPGDRVFKEALDAWAAKT